MPRKPPGGEPPEPRSAGSQTGGRRMAVRGLLARHTPGGWVTGSTCTLLILPLDGGWLLVPQAYLVADPDDGGPCAHAAWITEQDGATIAALLGGPNA